MHICAHVCTCRKNLLCVPPVKHIANELRHKIGGWSLAGRKRILRLGKRIKGDARRFEINSKEMLEETLGENPRKKAEIEEDVTNYMVDIK